MEKKEYQKGEFIVHFYPFCRSRIEKGTPCTIIRKEDEICEVKVNLVGFSGVYRVAQSMIKEVV